MLYFGVSATITKVLLFQMCMLYKLFVIFIVKSIVFWSGMEYMCI